MAHTPSNFSSFGSASIYNFEKWTTQENSSATISYYVVAGMTGTEDDKMRYMMGNWIQQIQKNADGFAKGRIPTTMEMKRFCVKLTTQVATSQQNQLQSTKQPTKKVKRVRPPQVWHSNPSRKNEKTNRYLAWPLTEAMVNREAKTSRRLRAYAKVLPGKYTTATVKQQLLGEITSATNVNRRLNRPPTWTDESTVQINQ
jgi:hypothetical protein